MANVSLVDIEQTLISVIILFILLVDTLRTFKRSKLRSGLIVILTTTIFLNIINYIYCYGHIYRNNIVLIYAIPIINYSMQAFLCGYIFLFLAYLYNSKLIKSRIMSFISTLPLDFSLVLIITSPFSKLVFYPDENNYIQGGVMLEFIHAISLLYIFLCLFSTIYYINKNPNRNIRVLYTVLIIFSFVAYITILFDINTWNIFSSLSTLIFYLIIQHENISKDPLTKLSDRKYSMYDVEILLSSKKNNNIVLLMIDGDHFKHINDTYGHIEGDKSLIKISEAISFATRSLRSVTTTRYGGDEFLVCFLESYENEGEVIAQRIHSKLAELNIISHSPYNLTISIGIARKTNAITTVEELIDAADTKLYEIKEKKKSMNNF